MKPRAYILYFQFFSFYLAVLAHAAPRPKVEKWKKSPVMFGEVASKDLFKARLDKEKCLQALDTAQKKFHEAEDTLKELIAKEASAAKLKAAEAAVKEARKDYLNKIDPFNATNKGCGFCAVTLGTVKVTEDDIRKEENKPPLGGEEGKRVRETWFQSHGVCSVKHVAKEFEKDTFNKIQKFLRTPHLYETTKNGFRLVLKFGAFDDAKKEPLKEGIQNKDFYALMGVGTDFKFLSRSVAFNYYILNSFDLEKNKDKHFELEFKSVPRSGNGKKPLTGIRSYIQKKSVTGKKISLTHLAIENVIGYWSVDRENEEIRYSTAAIFPGIVPPLKMGHEGHLETMVRLMDKFFPAEAP